MDLSTVFNILETGGPVGMAAIFCVMWYLERRERQSAQTALLAQSNAMIKALVKFEAVLDRIDHRLD